MNYFDDIGWRGKSVLDMPGFRGCGGGLGVVLNERYRNNNGHNATNRRRPFANWESRIPGKTAIGSRFCGRFVCRVTLINRACMAAMNALISLISRLSRAEHRSLVATDRRFLRDLNAFAGTNRKSLWDHIHSK